MSRERTPFALLLELQRRARDDSARAAQRARRDAETADATLRMLENYRAQQTVQPRVDSATDVSLLRVREVFARRLERAIGAQTGVVDRLAGSCAEHDRRLADRQRRLMALETLVERRERGARERSERREQAATDEFALQAYLRARSRQDDD